MHHSRIILLISSFAIALLGGLFVSVTNTQAAELPTSLINTASAKEEDVLTADQRKAILKEIISSSQSEIRNLTDTLNDLKLDETWSIARDHFIATLATSSEYYTSLETRLGKEDVSLDEIKSIAADLKTWRETTYSPALKEAGNLILTFQTESVYSVVQLRSVKIGNDIKKLDRQKLVNTEVLKKYLAQAEHSIKNARTLINKAKDIYFIESVAPLQPKQKAMLKSATSTADEILPPTEETIPTDPQDQVRDLAKESIKELKTAYELFFKMNDRIRK